MKLAPIQAAIAAVQDLDGGARIRRALAELMNARRKEEREENAHTTLGSPHVARLRRVMTNALKPHTIAWDNFNTGLSIDGRDNSSSICLRGVISPATAGPRFGSSLRVTLRFDMHSKSAEQFASQVALLKAGADAIQAGGY